MKKRFQDQYWYSEEYSILRNKTTKKIWLRRMREEKVVKFWKETTSVSDLLLSNSNFSFLFEKNKNCQSLKKRIFLRICFLIFSFSAFPFCLIFFRKDSKPLLACKIHFPNFQRWAWWLLMLFFHSYEESSLFVPSYYDSMRKLKAQSSR